MVTNETIQQLLAVRGGREALVELIAAAARSYNLNRGFSKSSGWSIVKDPNIAQLFDEADDLITASNLDSLYAVRALDEWNTLSRRSMELPEVEDAV